MEMQQKRFYEDLSNKKPGPGTHKKAKKEKTTQFYQSNPKWDSEEIQKDKTENLKETKTKFR